MTGGVSPKTQQAASSDGNDEESNFSALQAAGLITQSDSHGNQLHRNGETSLLQNRIAEEREIQRLKNQQARHGEDENSMGCCGKVCTLLLTVFCCLPCEDTSKSRYQRHVTLLPPQRSSMSGRKCLVLDLDETLVHSSFLPVPNPDYIIPVVMDGKTCRVYVLKRPGVDLFLERLGKLYEIVVFTASLAKYADPLLDMLDVNHVIEGRLFREACTLHAGNYVKDLNLLGRPVKSTIIVDNSPASYLFHPSNAIGVSSFIDDMDDRELFYCLPFLESLVDVQDVSTALGSYPEFIAHQMALQKLP